MTVPYTNTTGSASISSTEYSLPTASTTRVAQTTLGRLECLIDASAMTATETYDVFVYDKVNGGTQRLIYSDRLVGVQAYLYRVPVIYLCEGWDISMIKVAGTDRTIAWSIRQDVGNTNTATWNSLATVALPLVPTTAGRTLDVSAGGEAGVDWANVGSPTTTVGLSGTTVKVATDNATNEAGILTAVSNIAVTGAALNATAASETITTGSGSGGVTNTTQQDGTFDNISDTAGTLDFYYEFDISGTSGAVGVGSQWVGYVVGLTNTVKVYARNWGAATWEQVGSIVGIAGTVTMTDEWELTSAHTSAGLVRIRFAATGLTSATVKTDRILLGYTVVPPTVASIQSGLATSAALGTAQTDITTIKGKTNSLVFTVANQVDSNVIDWKGSTAPAMTGDAFARLGAPAGASVSADVAAVKSDTAAVKLKTDNLPSDPADASDIASAFSTVNSTLATIAGYIDTEVASLVTAVAALPSASTIASAVLAGVVEGVYTVKDYLRLMASATVWKVSGYLTDAPKFRDASDAKDRITATTTTDGRTAVAVDPS